MIRLFLIWTALFSMMVIPSFGQTMTSIFRQLPIECTPQLSFEQRDILLRNGEFILPGGDTVETVKYSIDTSDMKLDYLRYEFTFTTGQNGFIIFELRRFQKENGKQIIVFSRCGGLRHAYFQHEIKVFDLENNSTKENYSQTLLPNEVNIRKLLKEETPDSIKTEIEKAVSSCYNLYPETVNQIEWTIFPEYFLNDFEQFGLGNTLIFTWTGTMFDIKLKEEK